MAIVKLSDGTYTHTNRKEFGSGSLFLTLRRKPKEHKPRKPPATMEPDPLLCTFVFPCTFSDELRQITYRPANGSDLPDICKFVDFWLSGGAKRLKIPGAGADYFVPKGQQIGYLKYKTTYLATYSDSIIGWAVKSKNRTMIHLLIVPDYRGKGIGGHLLEILNPEFIRSKSDQSTGDPVEFYQKHGYEIIHAKEGKHHNIDIMQQVPDVFKVQTVT